MKTAALALFLGFLGNVAFAQDDIDRCKRAIDLMGKERPIRLTFPFSNWGDTLTDKSEAKRSKGLVLIQNRSIMATSDQDNVDTCSVLTSKNAVRFKLYIRPSLSDVPSDFKLEFSTNVDVVFEHDIPAHPVTIISDSAELAKCTKEVSSFLNNYFYSVRDGKSPAYLWNWTGTPKGNPIEETSTSYCVSFFEKLNEVIYNQFAGGE